MAIPKKKRPADANRRAKSIVDDLTGQSEPVDDGKDPAAVARGRAGGAKGGKARSESLTPEERTAIAKRAAASRWNK